MNNPCVGWTMNDTKKKKRKKTAAAAVASTMMTMMKKKKRKKNVRTKTIRALDIPSDVMKPEGFLFFVASLLR